MRVVTIPIGGIEVCDDRGAVLVTHGLGSCVAVMTWDPVCRVGGMLHFQLPSAALAGARLNAGSYADSGIPLLFEKMYMLGAKKRDIVVKVAGGGSFHGDIDTFDIGRRNYTMMRKILWKNQVLIAAEDIGGNRSRTARLFVDTGPVTIQSGSEVVSL